MNRTTAARQRLGNTVTIPSNAPSPLVSTSFVRTSLPQPPQQYTLPMDSNAEQSQQQSEHTNSTYAPSKEYEFPQFRSSGHDDKLLIKNQEQKFLVQLPSSLYSLSITRWLCLLLESIVILSFLLFIDALTHGKIFGIPYQTNMHRQTMIYLSNVIPSVYLAISFFMVRNRRKNFNTVFANANKISPTTYCGFGEHIGNFDPLLFWKIFFNNTSNNNPQQKLTTSDNTKPYTSQDQLDTPLITATSPSDIDIEHGQSQQQQQTHIDNNTNNTTLSNINNTLKQCDNAVPMLYFVVNCFATPEQAKLFHDAEKNNDKFEFLGSRAVDHNIEQYPQHVCHLYPIQIEAAVNLSPPHFDSNDNNNDLLLKTIRNGDIIEMRYNFSLSPRDEQRIITMRNNLYQYHKNQPIEHSNVNLPYGFPILNYWGEIQIDLLYVLDGITPLQGCNYDNNSIHYDIKRLAARHQQLQQMQNIKLRQREQQKDDAQHHIQQYSLCTPIYGVNRFYASGVNNPRCNSLLYKNGIPKQQQSQQQFDFNNNNNTNQQQQQNPMNDGIAVLLQCDKELTCAAIQPIDIMIIDDDEQQLNNNNNTKALTTTTTTTTKYNTKEIYQQSGYTGISFQFKIGQDEKAGIFGSIINFLKSCLIWCIANRFVYYGLTIIPLFSFILTLIHRIFFNVHVVYHHKQLALQQDDDDNDVKQCKVILPFKLPPPPQEQQQQSLVSAATTTTITNNNTNNTQDGDDNTHYLI